MYGFSDRLELEYRCSPKSKVFFRSMEVDDMSFRQRYPIRVSFIIALCMALFTGSARGKAGLLGHCDFGVHQVQRSAEDVQFYSDWLDPFSWITFGEESISSHAATRHFWLFLQVSAEELSGAFLQAADLRSELEAILARTGEDPQDAAQRTLLIQNVLQRCGQDIGAKGDYFEIILSYDPLAPNPNPLADFQLAYPGGCYFYILAVYNLEIPRAVDMIWSDFAVAAFLSSFTAEPGRGEVILEWTTQSEQGNLGFHILRRDGFQGSFLPLTERLIPSTADGHSQSPQSYRWIDRQVTPGKSYQYQLQDVSFDGHRTVHGTVTAAPLSSDAQPREFQLLQNYPNPFNAGTQVSYIIPRASPVLIRIYDVRGELVKTLVDGHQEAGRHVVGWNGQTEKGQPAGSGLYFCSFEAQGHSQVMKMVLLR